MSVRQDHDVEWGEVDEPWWEEGGDDVEPYETNTTGQDDVSIDHDDVERARREHREKHHLPRGKKYNDQARQVRHKYHKQRCTLCTHGAQ